MDVFPSQGGKLGHSEPGVDGHVDHRREGLRNEIDKYHELLWGDIVFGMPLTSAVSVDAKIGGWI